MSINNDSNKKTTNENIFYYQLILIIGISISTYGQTKEHDMKGIDMNMNHETKKTAKTAPKKVTVKKQTSKTPVKKKASSYGNNG